MNTPPSPRGPQPSQSSPAPQDPGVAPTSFLGDEVEAHVRLTQKMDAIGLLAGTIAHDFNNTLSGLLGFAQLLQQRAEPGSPLHHELGLIHQAAEQAAALSKRLMGFARRRLASRTPVALDTVVEEALALLTPPLAINIQVLREWAPALPPVLGDRAVLVQALLHLLRNAAEAMSDQGGLLRVQVVARPLGERERQVLRTLPPARYLCLTVSDTGVGMTPETQARMFEPFFTTKAAAGGKGIGLALVYRAVLNHGGDLLVDSAEGRGTAVQLFLPVAEPQPALDAPAAGR